MGRALLIFILSATSAMTARAEIGDELTRTGFRASVCNIDSMTLDFKLDESFGEPLITSKVRWRSGSNTASHCLSRLTHVWVKARKPDGTFTYIKFSPEIVPAGSDFGSTATESPNWADLFCSEPVDGAPCEARSDAQALFRSELAFESFEVVTEARSFSTMPPATSSQTTAAQRLDNDAFSLDSLLAEAVDEAIDPEAAAAAKEPEEPQLTAEQIEDQRRKQRDEQAREAVNNVVTLIASSLAQFTAPGHECESERVVANWVQARGTCQLNFRSEANHEFLCAEDEESKSVRATRRANINLETDLARISPIRVSNEGWASVVLELSEEIRTTTEGNYKTNRWHFTADTEQVEDLTRLASSLLTLKQYCQADS